MENRRTASLQLELQGYFRDQEARVVSLIEKHGVKHLAKSLSPNYERFTVMKSGDAVQSLADDPGWCYKANEPDRIHIVKQAMSVAEILDTLSEAERQRLLLILERAGVTTITVGGQTALVGVMGQSLEGFAISDAVYRDFLEHTVTAAKSIADTAATRVIDTIAKGLSEGETRSTIARMVRETYDGLSLKQSAVIAQTESHGAMAAGTLEGYRFGGTEEKSWMHFFGASKVPRSGHAEADGQTVKIDAPFMVAVRAGGVKEPLAYPGDYSASLAQVINCHCQMMPGSVLA